MKYMIKQEQKKYWHVSRKKKTKLQRTNKILPTLDFFSSTTTGFSSSNILKPHDIPSNKPSYKGSQLNPKNENLGNKPLQYI